MAAVHSHVLPAQILERAQKQSGKCEQNQRERHLRDNQNLRQHSVRTCSRASCGPSARIQCTGDIGARAAHRRGNPKQNSRHNAGSKRKQQHVRIRRCGESSMRGPSVDEMNDRACGPEGQAQSQPAAGQRQQQRLNQNLPHNSAAARAQREPCAELSFARCRFRQEQIRKIGACNQQHDANHNHQHRQRRLELLPHIGQSRPRQQWNERSADLSPPPLRDLRSFLLGEKTLEFDGRPGLCLCHGYARLPPRHDIDPEQAVWLQE